LKILVYGGIDRLPAGDSGVGNAIVLASSKGLSICALELLCYSTTDRPVNDRRLVSDMEKHGTAKIWQTVWISCYTKLLPRSFYLQLFKRGLEFRPA